MKLILSLVLAATGLLAADATGTWTGNLTRDNGEAGPAHLILKQDGTKVTGTAGPGVDEQRAIQNGKAEDGKVIFEITTENATMKFVLKQEGDAITGDVSRESNGETQRAKLAVTRRKQG